MTDPFDTGSAEESTGQRENFVGKVVRTALDLEEGDEYYSGEYENDIDLLYEIDVLDKDWDNLSELGVDVKPGSLNSKWMVFVGHLENIHGPETVRSFGGPDEMLEFLEGKVYEFRDVDFTADEDFTFEHAGDGKTINFEDSFGDFTNVPNNMVVPVAEVTDPDRLADLGAEDEGAVDEVDF